jgi:hypothetical protein
MEIKQAYVSKNLFSDYRIPGKIYPHSGLCK